MKVILFSANYCKLLISVLCGKHETSYPLGIKWRWQHRKYFDL